MLAFLRYDRVPHVLHRVAIPKDEARFGLYVRGSVPFRLRVDVVDGATSLRVRVVLAERSEVRLYRERYEGPDAGGDPISYEQFVVVLTPAKDHVCFY